MIYQDDYDMIELVDSIRKGVVISSVHWEDTSDVNHRCLFTIIRPDKFTTSLSAAFQIYISGVCL